MSDLPESIRINDLSDREIEILRLLATGASNKDIAQQLFISPNTVKVHLRNIFAKISVASRTEAAMLAVRAGLVRGAPGAQGEQDPSGEGEAIREITAAPLVEANRQSPDEAQAAAPQVEVKPPPARWKLSWPLALIGVILLVFLTWGGVQLARSMLSPTAPVSTPQASAPRWEPKADLLTPRAGLAATAYDNAIYAIGGEDAQGVTGAVERYQPDSDAWQTLTPKPLAVAEIHAAVIGGKIYVPGGRLASGQLSAALEIYDPRLDTWTSGAPLPIPVSAYALAAYEGRLYLFGGWDGTRHLALAFAYDPDQDAWESLSPLPTGRSACGAAVVNERIIVVGGFDGENAVDAVEAYRPDQDNPGAKPWKTLPSLPEARAGMGVASVADLLHVVGGAPQDSRSAGGFIYLPQTNTWQLVENPPVAGWRQMGVVGVGSFLYVLGGQAGDQPSAFQYAYQAIYTIGFPIIR